MIDKFQNINAKDYGGIFIFNLVKPYAKYGGVNINSAFFITNSLTVFIKVMI
ncbi:MAG: hypothetical protein LBV16_02405 [Elusimicrobiota bacterium]|jgi:hypothetical protein|nr:hypothetical protein [Elusimicrobiota bacterium]